jgi:hypothetical protein
MHGKERQCKAWHGKVCKGMAKIRHGMARQGRTWNDKAWQGKARKGNTP